MGQRNGLGGRLFKGEAVKDTAPGIEAKLFELMMKKTPEERLIMGCGMFDTAKTIVVSSIRDKHPGISASDLRKEVFLRIYAADFEPRRKQAILKWLEG